MRTVLVLVSVFLFSISASAVEYKTIKNISLHYKHDYFSDFSPFSNEGKSELAQASIKTEDGVFWGYINKNYEFVIPPKFDYVCRFHNDIAVIIYQGKRGFIGKDGYMILEPIFDDVGRFYEDLAGAKAYGKWGYIDKSGKWVIEPKFDYAGVFYKGESPVVLSGKTGVINKKGGYIIKPNYDSVFIFTEDKVYATVKCINNPHCDPYLACYAPNLEIEAKWGFVDEKENIIIDYKYDCVQPTRLNGFYSVKESGKWHVIDKNGNYIQELEKFDRVGYFQEGLAWVIKSNKWGLINEQFQTIIEPQYTHIFDSQGGLMNFWQADRKGTKILTGILDTTGKIVVEPIYGFIEPVYEDFVRVWRNSPFGNDPATSGFINIKTNSIIKPIFTRAGDFSEGYAYAKIDDKQGFIDANGEFLINVPNSWKMVHWDWSRFEYGLAQVQVDGKWGAINTKGELVIKPQFYKVHHFNPRYIPFDECPWLW